MVDISAIGHFLELRASALEAPGLEVSVIVSPDDPPRSAHIRVIDLSAATGFGITVWRSGELEVSLWKWDSPDPLRFDYMQLASTREVEEVIDGELAQLRLDEVG